MKKLNVIQMEKLNGGDCWSDAAIAGLALGLFVASGGAAGAGIALFIAGYGWGSNGCFG